MEKAMNKTMRAALTQASAAVLALGVTAQVAHAATVVDCVGDSITAGYSLAGNQSYPYQLSGMLGGGYTVNNYGVSGTTMLKNGNYPYWGTSSYTASLRSNPNYVIIALGTNDSKPYNWSAHGSEFVGNYQSFISSYTTLGTHPKAFVCFIPPYYLPNFSQSDFPDPSRIPNLILPAIQTVVNTTGAPSINNYNPLLNHQSMYTDGVHPNVDGANILAINAYNTVTGANVSLLSGANINDGSGPWGGNQAHVASAAFDRNSTTFYDANLSTGAWDGIDLGSGNTKSVKLICYSPRYGFEGRMVGGVFQGSNDKVNWASLAPSITTSPGDTYTSITVTGAPAYRYLRYYSAGGGSYGNIGELEFFGK